MDKFRPLRPDELEDVEKRIKKAKEDLAADQRTLAFLEDLKANGWWDGDLEWVKKES